MESHPLLGAPPQSNPPGPRDTGESEESEESEKSEESEESEDLRSPPGHRRRTKAEGTGGAIIRFLPPTWRWWVHKSRMSEER